MAEEAAKQPDAVDKANQAEALTPAGIADMIVAGDRSHGGGPVFSLVSGALGRLTTTQLLMVVNTGAVAVLAFGVLWLTSRPAPVVTLAANQPTVEHYALPASVPASHTEPSEPVQVASAPVAATIIESPGVSWPAAQSAFAKGEFAQALAQYSLLAKLVEADASADAVLDFIRFRMAICYRQLHRPAEAVKFLEAVAASKSPAVRSAANYELALVDELNQQYLQARTRAYAALATEAALQNSSPLRTHCEFLIARVLTCKALSYYNQEQATPWSDVVHFDPFEGLDEAAVQDLLTRKTAAEKDAAHGVRVEQTGDSFQVPLWTVTCLSASVSDVLNVIAGESQVDLRWGAISDAGRSRSVTMHLPNSSSQRACEVAAGAAGLVARFTGEQILVHNPASCESIKEQRDLLVDEAVSAWRRLLLREPQDSRVAEGYFALGLLNESSGLGLEAISDYQLTAKRFDKSRVAPRALLRAANLLIDLRDFSGARTSLHEMLDRYPECQESSEAYVSLGRAALSAGLHDEAFQVFKKLYYLDRSPASKAMACLGAGRSLHNGGKHVEAAQWLKRYIDQASSADRAEMAEAHLLLGRSYRQLGEGPRAAAALAKAVSLAATPGDRIDAGIESSLNFYEAGEPARAIASLQAIDERGRTTQQDYQIRKLTAQVYRSMGLPERAADSLRTSLTKVADPAAKTSLSIELGRCYREMGLPQEAASVLAQAIGELDATAEAHMVACELAEIYIEAGKPEQAITLAKGVLGSAAEAPLQERARQILAAAHMARQEYQSAAVALAGTAAPETGGSEQ